MSGEMGKVFRRMTLAALGLDNLDGVSEQSFDVVDRADAFVGHLLGGLSHVMPRETHIESRAADLSEHVLAGMSGLNGPRSATDLGEWQYWLDAALLMLFDEDEEEEEVDESIATSETVRSRAVAAAKSQQAKYAARQSRADVVRARVEALKKQGITPTMIQSLSTQDKRKIASQNVSANLTVLSEKPISGSVAAANEITGLSPNIREMTSQTGIGEAVVSLAKSLAQAASKTSAGAVFGAKTPSQVLASRLAEKVQGVSATLPAREDKTESETSSRWEKTVSEMQSGRKLDVSAIMRSMNAFEKAGMITKDQANEVRYLARAYGKLSVKEDNRAGGEVAQQKIGALDIKIAADPMVFKRSADFIRERISDLSRAVARRAEHSTESETVLKWQNAADRFERMHGLSDDVDRILLRDIEESAAELARSGIVPEDLVRPIAGNISAAQNKTLLAAIETMAARESSLTRELAAARNSLATQDFTVAGVNGLSAAHEIGSSMNYAVSNDSMRNFVSANTRETGFTAEAASLGGAFGEVSSSRSLISSREILRARKTLAAMEAAQNLGMHTLAQVVSGVQHSVSSWMNGLATAGVPVSGMAKLVSDIETLANRGRKMASGNHFETSMFEMPSVISAMGERLDAFVREVSASVSTGAYESGLDDSPAYVSVKSEDSSEASTGSEEISTAVQSVREVHKQLVRAREEAIAAAKELAVRSENAVQLPAEVMAALSGAMNVAALTRAQESLSAHLDEKQRAALAQTVSAAAEAQRRLDTVTQQMTVIERAARLSESLKQTSVAPRVFQPMMEVPVSQLNHPQGFAGLLDTVPTYANLQHNYDRMVSLSHVAEVTENRLEEMLSVVKPSEPRFSGYEDSLPSELSWVSQTSTEPMYPSQTQAGNLSSIWGPKKAASLYASEKHLDGVSLGQAIQQWAAVSGGHDVIEGYRIAESGERIKYSLNLSKEIRDAGGYALRHEVGQAYQPQSIRGISSQPIAASLSVAEKPMAFSGAAEFVPVMMGAKTESGQFTSRQTASFEPVSAEHLMFRVPGISGHVTSSNVDATTDLSSAVDRRVRLNLQNVALDLSPEDFVQRVAKPAMDQTAFRMPNISEATHALYSGYAALLQSQGEQRSVRTLKRAYMETLSRAGSQSAHSDIGLSSQSFVGLMGMNEPMVSAGNTESVYGYDTSSSMTQVQQASDRGASYTSWAQDIVLDKSPVASEQADNVDYSWVSNQASLRANTVRGIAHQDSRSDESGRVLERVEKMLDYVENVSNREVGVFSTNDTVRVLLEALPADGYLGDKGMPKWRQRNTKAARAAEARAIREALAKIGASPVQGVQRLNERQYVSPNLMPQQSNQAAPLFSGGSEGGGSSASSSGAGSSVSSKQSYSADQIPQEDLDFIAEEVYDKIVESLAEEIQRRREK